MKLAKFLVWTGGGSLILNIAMGIYIHALSTIGLLRPDWMPVAGKLMIGNMIIMTVLVVLIAHFINVEEVA